MRAFTTATLRRSGLHQIVFLGICAVGFSLTVNNLLGTMAGPQRWLAEATLSAPLVLMFAAVLGLRAALLLPVTARAVWVFRLTEEESRRKRQLAVVEHLLLIYGVLTPMAAVIPVQLWVLGLRATLLTLPLVLAMGVLLAEVALVRWHRIPFTCTYLPGKRPVAHTFLLLLIAFWFFTSGGSGWLQMAITRDNPLGLVVAAILALAGLFRWLRLQFGKNRPLEFEDELPEATFGLQLNR